MTRMVLAAFFLLLSDVPRVVPDIPNVPTPWVETGNRRARRRLARGRA